MGDYGEENLIITAKEHKILQKCKKRLKQRFNVIIQMPNVVTSAQSEADMIFVSISGETRNRERAKNFLSRKANMTSEKVESKENIVLVTLSDSEDEATNDFNSEESTDSVVQNVCHLDDSVCIIETCGITDNSSKMGESVRKKEKSEHGIDKTKRRSKDNSVCIIETHWLTDNSSKIDESVSEHGIEKPKRGSKDTSNSSEDVELCEVSSTTGELVPKKRKKVGVLTQELTEFIPLHKTKKARFEPSSSPLSTEEEKDDILIIDNELPSVRTLRPIVIDGCNVAMEHGKTSNTFSAKGIKLAVDYFLNRGHTQVTAFVPRFRRHCNRKNFPTTDPEILDDLAKKQHVVFTPSRRVNGKCIVSYDDRFIVQLAAANGGVILSNDNYRDLISENDSFKEVIENRLLLFCFVGDMLMIPSDPMGRAGPSLDDFLSFPPDSEKS